MGRVLSLAQERFRVLRLNALVVGFCVLSSFGVEVRRFLCPQYSTT